MKDHEMELRERVEYRLKESYCAEPGCEYHGKPAVQGHCFHRPDDYIAKYITRLHRRAEDALRWEREQAKNPEDYLARLESMFVWAMTSAESTLDSLIRLRRDNAALTARVAALESLLQRYYKAEFNPDAYHALSVEARALLKELEG